LGWGYSKTISKLDDDEWQGAVSIFCGRYDLIYQVLARSGIASKISFINLSGILYNSS